MDHLRELMIQSIKSYGWLTTTFRQPSTPIRRSNKFGLDMHITIRKHSSHGGSRVVDTHEIASYAINHYHHTLTIHLPDGTTTCYAPGTWLEFTAKPIAQPVPDTTQPVPDTTQPVPDTTQPVPDTTQPVPDTTQPNPPTYLSSLLKKLGLK